MRSDLTAYVTACLGYCVGCGSRRCVRAACGICAGLGELDGGSGMGWAECLACEGYGTYRLCLDCGERYGYDPWAALDGARPAAERGSRAVAERSEAE